MLSKYKLQLTIFGSSQDIDFNNFGLSAFLSSRTNVCRSVTIKATHEHVILFCSNFTKGKLQLNKAHVQLVELLTMQARLLREGKSRNNSGFGWNTNTCISFYIQKENVFRHGTLHMFCFRWSWKTGLSIENRNKNFAIHTVEPQEQQKMGSSTLKCCSYLATKSVHQNNAVLSEDKQFAFNGFSRTVA